VGFEPTTSLPRNSIEAFPRSDATTAPFPSPSLIIIIIIICLTPIELIAHKGVSNEAIYRRNPLGKKACKPLPTYYFIYLEASRFVPNRRVLTKYLKLFRLNSTRTVSHSKSGVDGRILGLSPPRFSDSTDCVRR
jgi:hypothetical protein